MSWLLPSVIATFTGTIALAVIFTFLAISEKQPYIKKWATGWWIYALRFVFQILMIKVTNHPLLAMGHQSATLVSGIFLLWGTYGFIDRKMPRSWIIVSGIILVWIIVNPFAGLSFQISTIPTFSFLGMVYLWTGVIFLRSAPLKGFGTSLTGYSFVLWGLHKMNYPFVRPLVWLAPWGYLLASLLEMLVALGILLTYFQKNKTDLEEVLEELYFTKSAVDRSSDSALWVSPEGKIIYANEAACKNLGYSREELLNMTVSDLDPNFPQHIWNRHWQELREKGSIKVETLHIRKDGATFPVEVSANLVNHKGKDYNCAFIRDISERKKAEYESELNNERLQSLLLLHEKRDLPEQKLLDHALEEAVRLTESEYGYLHLIDEDHNRASINFWSKETRNNCNVQKRPHSSLDRAGIWADCVRLRKTVVHNDYLHNPDRKGYPDDHLPIKRHLSAPVFDGDKIVAIIGVANKESPYNDADERQLQLYSSNTWDIIKQKRFAGEREKVAGQLYQAQKMEAIGTLAGGIAHDFNNILSAILGYTEISKDDAPPGSQLADDLDKVLTAANRAKDLVRQILAFSRQTDIEPIPLRIQPLIKEGLKMLRSSIPTTISISEDIDPETGPILADPTQIHQVIMNLCTNAYHAMEETGGALSVSLKTTLIRKSDENKYLSLPSGRYAELIVSDTGGGIGPDIIDKVFDPYFTTKEPGKGTGMGLAISHGIITDYGGAITVESRLGEGTSFHVFLPLIEREEMPKAKKEEAIPLGKEKVLFVDDEEILAEMGRDILARLGYDVTVRSSSYEALQTFQNAPGEFDLVITDQTMPGMSGTDLARRILQIRPGMPIILCTGYSNLIDEDSAKAIGIKEFALKPLTKRKLAELIRKALDV